MLRLLFLRLSDIKNTYTWMKSIIITCCLSLLFTTAYGQSYNRDSLFIKQAFDYALTKGKAYSWLEYLSTKIGARLAGSPQAAAAVEYTKQELSTLKTDSVWLQECIVPHWKNYEPAVVKIINSPSIGTLALTSITLGNSVGTGKTGITAEVIEVENIEALEKINPEEIKGKIVFFNDAFDNTYYNTFKAYGCSVGQRVWGASRAAKFGAVGTIVRSMTNALDDVPHTGVTLYKSDEGEVPAVAISTKDAEQLSDLLKRESVRIYMRTVCEMLTPKKSYNVIAEIKGSTFPDEIILVGGHLDSWNVGQGAHDDGAGVVHSMEVLNILNQLNYQPQRTIRCVLFMNEENGGAGADAYAKTSNEKNEKHLLAIESDAGGFTPMGFTCNADNKVFIELFQNLIRHQDLLTPFRLQLYRGGSGADVSKLKSQLGLLCGLRPDSQRYFDYHHTPEDTFDKVNLRELELGAAAMTALVYLVDKYGLENPVSN